MGGGWPSHWQEAVNSRRQYELQSREAALREQIAAMQQQALAQELSQKAELFPLQQRIGQLQASGAERTLQREAEDRPFQQAFSIPQHLGEEGSMANPQFRGLADALTQGSAVPYAGATGTREGLARSIAQTNVPGAREGAIAGKTAEAGFPTWKKQFDEQLAGALKQLDITGKQRMAEIGEQNKTQLKIAGMPARGQAQDPREAEAFYSNNSLNAVAGWTRDPNFRGMLADARTAMSTKDAGLAYDTLWKMNSEYNNIKLLRESTRTSLPSFLTPEARARAIQPFIQLEEEFKRVWRDLESFWSAEQARLKERKWYHWNKP